jgi:hypothetical protein
MKGADLTLLWLGLAIGTSTAAISERPFAAQSPPAARRPAEEAVDHLLLGTADLDGGIAWVEERTGVRPAPGGSHPGRGTRNAVMSLGGRHYLEVIAPDPAQTTIAEQFRDLPSLARPTIITWAVNTTEIDALADRFRSQNVSATPVLPGSRKALDGRTLAWKALGVDSPAGRLAPFFIQWSADTTHPSQTSPGGCTLCALRFEHPDQEMVRGALERLGLSANVIKASKGALVPTMVCGRGEIELR